MTCLSWGKVAFSVFTFCMIKTLNINYDQSKDFKKKDVTRTKIQCNKMHLSFKSLAEKSNLLGTLLQMV